MSYSILGWEITNENMTNLVIEDHDNVCIRFRIYYLFTRFFNSKFWHGKKKFHYNFFIGVKEQYLTTPIQMKKKIEIIIIIIWNILQWFDLYGWFDLYLCVNDLTYSFITLALASRPWCGRVPTVHARGESLKLKSSNVGRDPSAW